MAKIPLAQRTEAGPTRAGAVKPGFNLARGAGISQVGKAIGGFAGDLFTDLVNATAANEEATFQGEVSTGIEAFETFVAANPGASYEDLGKERDKMFTKLDKAGQTATTRRAQQNNKNFMLQNKDYINQRTQTSMEAIRVKQQLLTYESHRKGFMNKFNRDGLAELNEDMIESGLLNPDVTAARQEQDFAIIDKAEKKVAIGNAVGIGFEAWQATVSIDDPDGDLNAAFDVIDALDVPEGDKQEIESELKTRVANRRAETKLEAEQADAKSVETINGWINKGELDGITDRIKKLPLTETRKTEEIKKVNAHIVAINKGNPSPYEQTDPETYFDLRRKIEFDPLSVTEADLAAVVGKGKDDGISTDDYEKLLGMIRPDSPLKRPAVTRAQASIQRIRAADKQISKFDTIEEELENERFYLGVSNDVDAWVLSQTAAGKEPTDEQIDQKTINLMRPRTEAIVLNAFELLVTPAFAEETTLQSKRFKAFKKDPAFERLSDEDVEIAKDLFRLGATLQEVLDNL